MSWIWTGAGTSGTDADIEDGEFSLRNPRTRLLTRSLALRIEWCKAYARVRRWREEVAILEEEWRRVPISLGYEAQKWVDRAKTVVDGDGAVLEGKVAYARKSSRLFLDLIERAEVTRTETQIKRGRSRRQHQRLSRSAATAEDTTGVSAGDSGDDDVEDTEPEDERGDVDSDGDDDDDDSDM
jgi:hypothetical protein